MAELERRRRLAVASYMPGHEYSDPHWPASGPVAWEAMAARLPENHHVQVLELPVQGAAALHFQAGARWVVLEIDEEDYEAHDGIVAFRRGRVVFNGPAPEARSYIVSRGLPPPSSIPAPRIVTDWSSGDVPDSGIVLGGFVDRVSAGNHGLAYAVGGHVRAGSHGIAVSDFADVTVGDFGAAVTRGLSATAGDNGLAKCDEFGKARAGRIGVAISDTGGEAIVGEMGVAIGMFNGSATAGDEGLAVAREDMGGSTGAAVAGVRGVALAFGDEGTVAAGVGGILVLVVNARAHVAQVGEHGIQPDVAYRLDEDGRFVQAPA